MGNNEFNGAAVCVAMSGWWGHPADVVYIKSTRGNGFLTYQHERIEKQRKKKKATPYRTLDLTKSRSVTHAKRPCVCKRYRNHYFADFPAARPKAAAHIGGLLAPARRVAACFLR